MHGFSGVHFHADILGAIQSYKFVEETHVLTFTLARRRCKRLHLLRQGSEIANHSHGFISWIDRNTNRRAKRLYPGNGVEFLALRKSLDKIGITLTTSFACPPHSDELAERMKRIMTSKVHAMISEAHIDHKFWEKRLHTRRIYITIHFQLAWHENKNRYGDGEGAGIFDDRNFWM